VTPGDDNLGGGHRLEIDGLLRLRNRRGGLEDDAEGHGHTVRDPSEDASGVVRSPWQCDLVRTMNESLCSLPRIPAARKPAPKSTALTAGIEKKRCASADSTESKNGSPTPGRQSGDEALDHSPNAVTVPARGLNLRDHPIRRLEVPTSYGRSLHVRFNLLVCHARRSDPPDLRSVGVESDPLPRKDLSGDRSGDDEGRGHPTGELPAATQVALSDRAHASMQDSSKRNSIAADREESAHVAAEERISSSFGGIADGIAKAANDCRNHPTWTCSPNRTHPLRGPRPGHGISQP